MDASHYPTPEKEQKVKIYIEPRNKQLGFTLLTKLNKQLGLLQQTAQQHWKFHFMWLQSPIRELEA